ncbi:MAG: hypothetical protein ACFE8M_04650 [Candidatus Hermodarchaeota archaeon]
MTSSSSESLESFLKTEIIKEAKELKGRYPSISEIVGGAPRILKVKNIYEMKEEFKNYYLIRVKNYYNEPKFRHFLGIILASQSSDFLVLITKELIKDIGNIKLIQFSIYPKNFRISLLSLKEILNKEDFLKSVKILKDLRINFKKKLDNIKNLIENK